MAAPSTPRATKKRWPLSCLRARCVRAPLFGSGLRPPPLLRAKALCRFPGRTVARCAHPASGLRGFASKAKPFRSPLPSQQLQPQPQRQGQRQGHCRASVALTAHVLRRGNQGLAPSLQLARPWPWLRGCLQAVLARRARHRQPQNQRPRRLGIDASQTRWRRGRRGARAAISTRVSGYCAITFSNVR